MRTLVLESAFRDSPNRRRILVASVSEGSQDLLLTVRPLGVSKGLTLSRRIDELCTDQVLAAQFRDAARKDAACVLSLSQFGGQSRIDPIDLLLHPPQRFAHSGSRDDIHELRLREADLHRELQGPIEDRLPGQVLEICKHDPVARLERQGVLRERQRIGPSPEHEAGAGECDRQGGRNNPAAPGWVSRSHGGRCWTTDDLELSPDVAERLVALRRTLGQAAADDVLEELRGC